MLSLFRMTILLAGAAAVFAQSRFDMTVRQDFFAGFTGDREALARGMKKCEDVLAADPRNAEALVWHGSGVFFQSGEAVKTDDLPKAMEFYRRGLEEMTAAVAMAPENVGVLIPRGATLLAASHGMQTPNAKELIKTGLADYEKVYAIQQPYFDKLNGHARGELLFGLAEGYQRLGDETRAREWFQKLAAVDDPENGHLKQARTYLETKQLTGSGNCIGCHVTK